MISALGLRHAVNRTFLYDKYTDIHISEVQLPQMILKIEFLLLAAVHRQSDIRDIV